jgi:hypothetical protein
VEQRVPEPWVVLQTPLQAVWLHQIHSDERRP